MADPSAPPGARRPPPFRTTLTRVLIVQVIALAILALLQIGYGR